MRVLMLPWNKLRSVLFLCNYHNEHVLASCIVEVKFKSSTSTSRCVLTKRYSDQLSGWFQWNHEKVWGSFQKSPVLGEGGCKGWWGLCKVQRGQRGQATNYMQFTSLTSLMCTQLKSLKPSFEFSLSPSSTHYWLWKPEFCFSTFYLLLTQKCPGCLYKTKNAMGPPKWQIYSTANTNWYF